MKNAGTEIQTFGELLDKTITRHKNIQTHWVTVTAVNWNLKTMTVTSLTDGLAYYNVVLGIGAFYTKPKIGTKAIIGMLLNTSSASYLIHAEAIEQYEIIIGDNHSISIDTQKYNLKINTTELTINTDGFLLKKENETLKKVLNDWQDEFGKLCDEINKIVVSVGVTPNVAAITQIKQQVATVNKNRLNTLLT